MEKLTSLFKEIIGVSPETDPNEITMERIEDWDSMAHMTLITQIEEEFEISLEAEEIMAMTTYPKIKKIIDSKINS
jgi:acyl carrier protein